MIIKIQNIQSLNVSQFNENFWRNFVTSMIKLMKLAMKFLKGEFCYNQFWNSNIRLEFIQILILQSFGCFLLYVEKVNIFLSIIALFTRLSKTFLELFEKSLRQYIMGKFFTNNHRCDVLRTNLQTSLF